MRRSALALAPALLVVAAVARPPFALVRALGRARRDILFHVSLSSRHVALTFDDGPDPAVTPRLLEVLAARGARATFFVIGSHAEQAPDVLRQIADAGHQIGNHLWTDTRSARQSDAQFERDLTRTAELLPDRLTVMRPGGGWIGRRKTAVAARHGYRCVLGSVYPYDAQFGLRPRVVADLSRRARPGTIFVVHEGPGRATVAAAADALLSDLGERGFAFVTVSELLELASPSSPRARWRRRRTAWRARGASP